MVTLMEAGYLAIAFVVYVVVTSIGGQVLTGVQTSQLTLNATGGTGGVVQTAAYNATGYGLTGILNLSQQSGTIGTILGAVVMIGLLMGAFYLKGKLEG